MEHVVRVTRSQTTVSRTLGANSDPAINCVFHYQKKTNFVRVNYKHQKTQISEMNISG